MDWWPAPVPFRLRIFFRSAFVMLTLATIGLALTELRAEKQLRYLGYGELFRKNIEQITARLQHPTGQLALLNPMAPTGEPSRLRPLLLPFAAIDFDDKAKAQQAVEMAGCLVQYPDHARLCVAVGNNPFVGGFIYTVGEFAGGPLIEHRRGDLDLTQAHRLRVAITIHGVRHVWIAPLETTGQKQSVGVTGRLTGFAEDAEGVLTQRPNREFRGWLWQENRCLDESVPTTDPAIGNDQCRKRTFYSVRLPVAVVHQALVHNPHLTWPPPDLAQAQVQVQVYAPGDGAALFDSRQPGAAVPFALTDLRELLQVGETLDIRNVQNNTEVTTLHGVPDSTAQSIPLLARVIGWLPVEGFDKPLEATRLVATAVGDYRLHLVGNVSSVNRSIGPVATRLAWFIAAMVGSIIVVWFALEARLIRRITLLTTRAAAVQRSARAAEGLLPLDLRDLQGRDELGLLANVLAELLQRVNEDIKREQIRADQEKDMLHAVGHEILSPLQSLTALHTAPDDPSLRYVRRMQQAVRLLYGSAQPSEAIMAAAVSTSTLDINDFLRHVSENAAHAGVAHVIYERHAERLMVKADSDSLEDVVTHVLSNANRYRLEGSPIQITLHPLSEAVEVWIYNQGPRIEPELIGRVFEYGVSDTRQSGAVKGGSAVHRGQGLFVAKTYMAKMGGTVEARNLAHGVEIILRLAAA